MSADCPTCGTPFNLPATKKCHHFHNEGPRLIEESRRAQAVFAPDPLEAALRRVAELEAALLVKHGIAPEFATKYVADFEKFRAALDNAAPSQSSQVGALRAIIDKHLVGDFLNGDLECNWSPSCVPTEQSLCQRCEIRIGLEKAGGT